VVEERGGACSLPDGGGGRGPDGITLSLAELKRELAATGAAYAQTTSLHQVFEAHRLVRLKDLLGPVTRVYCGDGRCVRPDHDPPPGEPILSHRKCL